VSDNGACVPWSRVSGEAFVAAAPSNETVMARLYGLTKAVVGPWIGHARSPWGEWDLTITFGADGHYEARAYNGTGNARSNPLAFYYGTDVGCDSLKQWRLSDLAADGTALGQIDVAFSYGPTMCGLPAWQGELSRLDLSATGNRLQFAFNRSDGYGPVQYDLWRACGPFDSVLAADGGG